MRRSAKARVSSRLVNLDLDPAQGALLSHQLRKHDKHRVPGLVALVVKDLDLSTSNRATAIGSSVRLAAVIIEVNLSTRWRLSGYGTAGCVQHQWSSAP